MCWLIRPRHKGHPGVGDNCGDATAAVDVITACQSAPRAQPDEKDQICKCLSQLVFFEPSVSICAKDTITPYWLHAQLLDAPFRCRHCGACYFHLHGTTPELWSNTLATAKKHTALSRVTHG